MRIMTTDPSQKLYELDALKKTIKLDYSSYFKINEQRSLQNHPKRNRIPRI